MEKVEVTKVEARKDKKTIEEEKRAEEDFLKRLDIIIYRIRKTPELYTKEVIQYINTFKQLFEKCKQQPTSKNRKFAELSVFLARIAEFYKYDMGFLHQYLEKLLEGYINQMNAFVRRKAVSALMILRSKNLTLPVNSLIFFFKLFSVQDKQIRKMINSHVVNDIKRMNQHHKNVNINKQIQNFIFEVLKKNHDSLGKRAIQIMIKLYQKSIWNDQKTVNIIAHGCLSESYQIKIIACYFLIETTETPEELSDSDDDNPNQNPYEIQDKKGKTKQTRSKKAKTEKDRQKSLKKMRKKMMGPEGGINFFPIDQIYNPQDFCEKVFAILKKSTEKFPVKMAMMSVISRMIGRHKLIIMNFYSYVMKYLNPNHKEIHKILAYLAESIHNLVPADDVEPLIKHLVDNFIHEKCTEQTMTMGLNTIREMCIKNPIIIDNFTLNYLSGFYGYRNKNVSRAAKSIINFYRDINPQLLDKKYRGRNQRGDLSKETQETLQMIAQQDEVVTHIDGTELLDLGGDIPLEMDRILTDQDFQQIRFLQQKKLEEEEEKRYLELHPHLSGFGLSDSEDDEDDEDDDDEDDEEQDDDDEDDQEEEIKPKVRKAQDTSKPANGVEGEDNEWEDQSEISQISDLSSIDGEADEIDENDGDDDEDDDDDDDDEDEDDDSEMINQKTKDMTEEEKSRFLQDQNRKRKQRALQQELEGFSQFEQSVESEQNPHGFIDAEKIAKFKKTKAETKRELREQRLNEVKEKHYHGPKDKGGGTNDREKQKCKPLLMLRPKKNKEKNKIDTLKRSIKSIKTHLGRVRSGKQADRRRKKHKKNSEFK